nr:transposase, mutator type [Tanacetum cinerariifolium]
MMIYLRNMVGFKMDYFKGMSYDDIHLIFKKYFNSNVAFLEKSKEQLEEEESRVLKKKTESSKEKVAKKQKLDEEVLVVDSEIYTKNNKPYFKIIRADGSHQLFLSFLSLLRHFNREDLEVLWQLVKERIASSKPKNFSNDFLLTTLTYMFEKPDVEAQVWKSQRGVYGLAKVKTWRLLESCGVYIITLTTTQMILLVERRYPLTRFTLDQMPNNVRLEVKEESKVSLELLRFVHMMMKMMIFFVDEENEIVEHGEDIDVIDLDGFDNDTGNDNETSNYKRRRQKVSSEKEGKDIVYLHFIKSRRMLKLYKNINARVRARCEGKVHLFTMSQGALKLGFKAYRKELLGLDGAFMKGPFRGWCGQAYKDLLWISASATTVKEFQKCMLELKKKNPKAHEWLNKIPLEA